MLLVFKKLIKEVYVLLTKYVTDVNLIDLIYLDLPNGLFHNKLSSFVRVYITVNQCMGPINLVTGVPINVINLILGFTHSIISFIVKTACMLSPQLVDHFAWFIARRSNN